MALPANLSYFLSRMQGVSTNYFKIFPNNTGTATPSKILRFELPSNSLLNLRSLQLMFSASTTGATAGGRLPNKIDSLIERYALYAGGVLVSHGYNQYNVLRHAKDVLQGNKKMLKMSEVRFINAPMFDEIAVKNLYQDVI